MLPLVRHDEHRGVVRRPLHVLPRRASPHAAALVVAPATTDSEWIRPCHGDEGRRSDGGAYSGRGRSMVTWDKGSP